MNQLTNQRVCDASPVKKGDRRSFRLLVKEIKKSEKNVLERNLTDRTNLLPIRRGQMNRSVLYALLWQMMCLSATDSKKSSFFYFSLARAYRYERNLAGVGIDAGRVNIFPDHQNRAREKEGREREFCRRIKRSKIGNGKKHYYTVLNGLKMLI